MSPEAQALLLQLLTLIVNGVLIPMVGTVLGKLNSFDRRIKRIETHLNLKEETS